MSSEESCGLSNITSNTDSNITNELDSVYTTDTMESIEDLVLLNYLSNNQFAKIPKQPRSFYQPIPRSHVWYNQMVPQLPLQRYLFFLECHLPSLIIY